MYVFPIYLGTRQLFARKANKKISLTFCFDVKHNRFLRLNLQIRPPIETPYGPGDEPLQFDLHYHE